MVAVVAFANITLAKRTNIWSQTTNNLTKIMHRAYLTGCPVRFSHDHRSFHWSQYVWHKVDTLWYWHRPFTGRLHPSHSETLFPCNINISSYVYVAQHRYEWYLYTCRVMLRHDGDHVKWHVTVIQHLCNDKSCPCIFMYSDTIFEWNHKLASWRKSL